MAIRPESDGYLSLKALAVYSGVSVRTLRNYLTRHTGALCYYRMDRKILVKRSDFDAWMLRYRVEPSEELDRLADALIGGGR